MRIGKIVSPIHALGPGERIGLWVKGCSLDCVGCMSEHYKEIGGGDLLIGEIVSVLSSISKLSKCDCLTISGGEPFDQLDDLSKLVKQVRPIFRDILIYTGYTLSELLNKDNKQVKIVFDNINLLIDGRYIKSLDDGLCVLRGSTNQKITFFKSTNIEEYDEYILNGRIVETYPNKGGVEIIGIS